jgi:hypothetical protein
VVEQVPEDKVQTDWLKLPVLLLVLQATVPVGSDPDAVALHVTDEFAETDVGEQATDVDEEKRASQEYVQGAVFG